MGKDLLDAARIWFRPHLAAGRVTPVAVLVGEEIARTVKDDGEDARRYYGGPDDLAEAIGLLVPVEPPVDDESDEANAARKLIRSRRNTVSKRIAELKKIGFIAEIVRPQTGRRAEYRLSADLASVPTKAPGETPASFRERRREWIAARTEIDCYPESGEHSDDRGGRSNVTGGDRLLSRSGSDCYPESEATAIPNRDTQLPTNSQENSQLSGAPPYRAAHPCNVEDSSEKGIEARPAPEGEGASRADEGKGDGIVRMLTDLKIGQTGRYPHPAVILRWRRLSSEQITDLKRSLLFEIYDLHEGGECHCPSPGSQPWDALSPNGRMWAEAHWDIALLDRDDREYVLSLGAARRAAREENRRFEQERLSARRSAENTSGAASPLRRDPDAAGGESEVVALSLSEVMGDEIFPAAATALAAWEEEI